MVRTKPSLFLTVPNALDAHTYSRADLITPPCHIVSAPPPMLTPALSRSSSISMNSSRSESDCEIFDEDDEEISLKTDAAPWTIDQDQALLSVPLSVFSLIINRHIPHIWTDHHCPPRHSRHQNHLQRLPQRSRATQFVFMAGKVARCLQRGGAFSNWPATGTTEVKESIWTLIHWIHHLHCQGISL